MHDLNEVFDGVDISIVAKLALISLLLIYVDEDSDVWIIRMLAVDINFLFTQTFDDVDAYTFTLLKLIAAFGNTAVKITLHLVLLVFVISRI
jgi:hypothetical protein